jgi:hypothetical protein
MRVVFLVSRQAPGTSTLSKTARGEVGDLHYSRQPLPVVAAPLTCAVFVAIGATIEGTQDKKCRWGGRHIACRIH